MTDFNREHLDTFLAVVRKYMQLRGNISQKDLAELTGIGVSTISRFLNQKTQILLEKINRHGTLFASACSVDGLKSIRICLLGYRMHYAILEKALKEIRGFIDSGL